MRSFEVTVTRSKSVAIKDEVQTVIAKERHVVEIRLPYYSESFLSQWMERYGSDVGPIWLNDLSECDAFWLGEFGDVNSMDIEDAKKYLLGVVPVLEFENLHAAVGDEIAVSGKAGQEVQFKIVGTDLAVACGDIGSNTRLFESSVTRWLEGS